MKGAGIAIGTGASAQASGNIYQERPLQIDRAALKSSLMDLYAELGASPLPLEQKMTLQGATGQAAQRAAGEETTAEALSQEIKQMGETFKRAGTAMDAGSPLGRKILNLAELVGPLVAGGARLVASWFGLPRA